MNKTLITSTILASLMLASCGQTTPAKTPTAIPAPKITPTKEAAKLPTPPTIVPVVAAAEQKLEDGTYVADPATSVFRWEGKKVVGRHYGTIALKEGNVVVKDNAALSGTFTMDMPTLTVLDGDLPALVTHLNSADFFNTAQFPTATLTLETITLDPKAEAGKPNATVKGSLTIVGIAQPISFPATIVATSATTVNAQAAITVDRTLYGIKYGSGSFFEDLGDKAIDNNFTLDISVNAKKSS